MSLMYESQIALLGAVIEVLEKDLLRNPNWQALVSLNAALGDVAYQDADQAAARARLEQALDQDPVYRARLRLIESVKMLQQAADALSTDRGPTVGTGSHEGLRQQPTVADENTLAGGQDHEDDLTKIRGVTRALQDQLRALGVTRFVHVAEWTSEDCKRIARALDVGRAISQQNWIEQAAVLAAKSKTTPQKAPPQQLRRMMPSSLARAMSNAKWANTPAHSSVSPPMSPPTPPKALHQSPNARRVSVEDAAREVVRRLTAQKANGNPLGLEPAALNTAKVAAPAAVEMVRGGQRVEFVPQIIPDPRRLALIQTIYDNQHTQSSNGASPSATSGEPVEPDTADAVEREPASAAPNKTCLTKTKFKRRRWVRKGPKQNKSDAKAPVSSDTKPSAPNVSGVIAKSEHLIPHGEELPCVEKEQNVNVTAPLSPPPIPDKARRLALRQRNRRRRPAGGGMGNYAERFGDGQEWRPGAPERFAPINSDDELHLSEEGINILAHVEEAHVKIVRSHRENGIEADPPEVSVRTEELAAPSTDAKSNNFGIRLPSKGLFKALKRD